MKVGEKLNFGQLATIFQICAMDADILSQDGQNLPHAIWTMLGPSSTLKLSPHRFVAVTLL